MGPVLLIVPFLHESCIVPFLHASCMVPFLLESCTTDCTISTWIFYHSHMGLVPPRVLLVHGSCTTEFTTPTWVLYHWVYNSYMGLLLYHFYIGFVPLIVPLQSWDPHGSCTNSCMNLVLNHSSLGLEPPIVPFLHGPCATECTIPAWVLFCTIPEWYCTTDCTIAAWVLYHWLYHSCMGLVPLIVPILCWSRSCIYSTIRLCALYHWQRQSYMDLVLIKVPDVSYSCATYHRCTVQYNTI